MSWTKATLGEIAECIQPGPFGSQLHSSDYSDYGVPIIMPKDMIEGKISHTNMCYVPEEHQRRLARHQVFAGDLLVARKGDVRKCVYITENENGCLTGSDCLKVSLNKEKCHSKYIYYQLRSAYIGRWLEKISIGATMPSLNSGLLGSIELNIPPIEVQKEIADILSVYDDLIENNQKQIKLLEEAAQRLYKEWFVDLRFPGHENVKIVDGVPEGWERCPIYDIAEYINGYAFKPCDWQDKGKPIIKIKEMNEGITKDTPRNIGEKIPDKYNIVAGDILFSWSATLSAMIWDLEDGILNQHIFKVIPKEDVCREYVLQSILQTLTEFNNLTTGATMKHIQRGKLKEVFVKLPCKKIMDKYRDIAEIQREAIISLRKKNAFLQEARDRLLPKLISGEIQV